MQEKLAACQDKIELLSKVAIKQDETIKTPKKENVG